MRRVPGPVTLPALLLVLALVLAPATSARAAGAGDGGQAPPYTNPVTAGYSIDFPDPAVMRGKDGFWYAYGTGGPFDEQNARSANSKIAKSADLRTWTEVGPFFAPGAEPPYAEAGTGYWAPDVRYLNGKYLLYVTVPNTTTAPGGGDPAIGVATAPTPAGPWTPEPEPLIPPRPFGDAYDTTIDPALFTDTDGTHYLYWGGFDSGLWMVRLSDDGLTAETEPRKIGAARYEGPYVVHRDGWYYLFASSANCCAGPTTGYSVFVGRAKSPLGPFLDRNGKDMVASRAGGTPVLAPNGNKWIGTGHHSAVVDASGQDWMTYHAIDRADPWLDVQPGFTMRPMSIDRLDWIDGWPIVNAGAFATDTEQPNGPVVRGEVDDRFEDADATADNFDVRSGELAVEGSDPHSGGYAALGGDTLATTRVLRDRDVRVEADVRTSDGAAGVAARASKHGDQVRAVVDAERRELRVEAVRHGHVVRAARAKLPDDYAAAAWHTIALQVRGRTASVDVTDSRLGDPWATTELRLPSAGRAGAAGVVANGDAEVDNFSANALYRPVRETVPPPAQGRPLPAYSDEFDDGLAQGWSWLREDTAARVVSGQFRWPTQDGDLVGDGTPAALLREMPEGSYTVTTKLRLGVGTDDIRNFQQAGLLVYVGDDEFLRLDVVAVADTRIVEFGKETVFQGRRSWGGGLADPPGETTWLKLAHTLDPDTGEHRIRAGSSTDGRHWTWGLTWTLPADADPRVGLVSQGSLPETTAEHGPAMAEFDYVRVTR